MPQFGESAQDDVARFAATAEQLGADSLWVGDRLLAAVHPTVGYAGGDTIPEQFRTNLDPFIALTVAATATSRVRLGSSVFVAPWYPPVQLARQLTSIDVISHGRLLPGFGIGWSPDEYQAAGAPFARRGAQLDELLDVLDALWTANPVQHEGPYWSIPESWVNLKPVQRPRPPIYLGAFTPPGLKRVGARADGWMAGVQVPDRVHLKALNWQRGAIDKAALDSGTRSGDHSHLCTHQCRRRHVGRSGRPGGAVVGRQRLPRRLRRFHVRGDRNRRPTGVGGTAAGAVSGLLASLRVLDLGGADSDGVGRLFADLGADVLKIEPPGGSAARQALPTVAGTSIAFAVQNANKRSVVLDPASVTDRERLVELAGTADILVDSAGGAAAFGTSCAALAERFGQLVALSVTDFGTTGPYASWRATDPVLYALSTALSRTGPTVGKPVLPPNGVASATAAVQAAWAALAAYYHRLRSGRGDYIDFSRFEAVVQSLDPPFGSEGQAAVGLKRSTELWRGRPRNQNIYPIFGCKDGYVRDLRALGTPMARHEGMAR